MEAFKQWDEVDPECDAICRSPAIWCGMRFDTASGVIQIDEERWQPVMLCGRHTPKGFLPKRVIVLTDEGYSQQHEASRVSWQAHSNFHTSEMQERLSGDN